ncbi:hypothetical protein BCR33DRAFT_723630 [Rhizoclosmatium globosum]|uniref:Uncharacterized protein n=1 Tax=Rhizoclosmatium globosum TaxID=329046 RepID=A0A1Y2BB33_9FUNG|nr:hypothetical protein BCR33DRAFT_723630 [Rhizoclosmatium globosum]|eukprot:ORY32061.1 hypothetical protein BCR33DRAFT_723630 [Rhizoclosmatium globosum]
MGPVQVGTTYRLDSIETLVWLTSQTASNQRLFVANVCFGFFKKGIHDYYTLLEILDILQLYSEYLLKTNGLSRSVAEKIQNCGPFYEGSTSSSIYKKELWSSTSRTWLHSQNTSIQILFINQICEDPAVNSTLTVRLFYLFDLSDSVVRKVMLDCPKIQDVVGGLRLNMAIFNSIAAVSAIGAAALAMLVYYEATILVGSQSILEKVCSKFNVLLCCCFVFGGLDNALFALFIWFKILNEVTGMAEGVQMADASILASDLFHTLWCISYLSFCWIRSESILVNVWPQTHWLIWIFFILSGIAMFGPLLSDAVFLTFKELVFKIGLRSMNTISFILEALSSCLLLLIDALLLFTFTQFVKQLQENLNLEKTQRVLIICQYGLVSSIICVIYSGLGIAKPILYWNDHHGENAFRFKILTSVVSLMVTFTLLFMKLSLFFDSKRTAVTVGIMKPEGKEHSGNGTTLPAKSSQEK